MLFRAVAFVGEPAVIGEFSMQVLHDAISGHFGDDRCGGNRHRAGITIHERVAAAGQGRRIIAIHKCELCRECKRPHSARHGEVRRLANIDEVDFIDACLADADHGAFYDFRECFLARFRRHLLRIVQAARNSLAIQDDRRRDHGAGQRSTSRLIHSGDRAGHGFQQPRLKNVMRQISHPWKRLSRSIAKREAAPEPLIRLTHMK